MKKKKRIIPIEFTPAISLVGISTGTSIIGGTINSKLPPGTKNPLTTIGSTTGNFISPLTTLGVMNFTTKHLKKLNKKI